MAQAAVRKFISVRPLAATDEGSVAYRSLNIAYNRLGGTLTGIGASLQNFAGLVKFHGEFLKDIHQRNVDQIKQETQSRVQAQEDLLGRARREEGRQKDAASESLQEREVERKAKESEAERNAKVKIPKKEKSWIEKLANFLEPVFSALQLLVGPFLTYGFFDWMSKPENLGKIKTFLNFFAGIWAFSRNLTKLGIGLLLDGISRTFGANPGKEGLAKHFDQFFGVLQIIGGIVTLWLASRVLMPWKLIGDVKFMTSLADGLNKSEQSLKEAADGADADGTKKPQRTDSKGRTAQQRLRDMKRAKRIKAIRGNLKIIAKGGGLLRGALSLAGRAGRFLFDKTVQGGKALADWAKNNFAKLTQNAKTYAGNAWNWGKEQAGKIGELAKLAKNPKKLGEVVLEKLKQTIKPIIEKDDRIKKVFDVSRDPKKGKEALKALVSKTMKSPGLKSFRNFLVAAKKNAKIGGIDKVIASVLALVDYGVFGESPVNAVVKAIGGLLGYAAGFAIGAPFGGVPGFVTGAAGGFAGEWVADRILEGLAKIPALKSVKDPLARMLPGPYKDRPLVRDPASPAGWGQALQDAAGSAQELAAGGQVKPNKDTSKEKTSNRGKNVEVAGGGEKAVIAAGKLILQQGFTVGEHPNFRKNNWSRGGPNTGKGYNPKGGERVGGHSGGSAHYKGLAIDVTDWRGGDWLGRTKELAEQMYQKRKELKVTQIIHDGWGSWFSGEGKPTKRPFGGHDSHLHLAFANGKGGGSLDPVTGYGGDGAGGGGSGYGGDAQEIAPHEPPSADTAMQSLLTALKQHLGDTQVVPAAGQPAPVPTPHPSVKPVKTEPKQEDLNKVAENLSKLSTDKVRRDKEGKVKTNTQLMVMQQNIITPSRTQAQAVSYGSTSPLVLSK
ncbi:hypothetical protein SSZBM1_67 [Synechococcus phage S-SZBM1]|uniref:Uncharacterized protein n=1 Tax=Synechococcus phage S-SZBM1 TaxID=2926475 RepID=A0AC61TSI0_9CAUD|nr:hypothetical protein PP650_gp209 [Synechococcus phage S-SZBM1]UNH61184.1 hypothetical protein SSZBM1_67 [Synechococcus phage S-SZBM1]